MPRRHNGENGELGIPGRTGRVRSVWRVVPYCGTYISTDLIMADIGVDALKSGRMGMSVRRRFLPPGWYPDSDRATQREIESFSAYISGFARIWIKCTAGLCLTRAGTFQVGWPRWLCSFAPKKSNPMWWPCLEVILAADPALCMRMNPGKRHWVRWKSTGNLPGIDRPRRSGCRGRYDQ